VATLGFAPTLERCSVCGVAVDGAVAFSASHGGALCGKHRGEARTAKLSGPDAVALHSMVNGRLPDPGLTARHEAAHRRLLLQFVRHHLAEQRPLPALAFWDARSWIPGSS
jgi:recombinational DNA repair protein (RecF pathway)